MQLVIKIGLDRPLTLPLAYHHIQQSIIYRLMGDSEGTPLHDGGYGDSRKTFKLFTFGPLTGKYHVESGRITFLNEVSFEFRCVDEEYGGAIAGNIIKRGIDFGDDHFSSVEVRRDDKRIEKNDIKIKMISPITVYETSEDGKTKFFNPSEKNFVDAVIENAYHKYAAFTQGEVRENIGFEAVHVDRRDKYLTRYKGFIIEGYKGIYRLSGNTDMLKFLYNAGLGGKNSQGFGMFEEYFD